MINELGNDEYDYLILINMSNLSNQPQTEKGSQIDVYFLAAPEDEAMCRSIKKHLTPIIRNSKTPIKVHSDFEISPGHDINKYKQKLFEAEIVLAFISADYLYNNECHRRTQKVIERYNKKETILLPILVRNCLWNSTPFGELQLLPRNRQPLNNKEFWNSEDDALTIVAGEIHEAINSFNLGGHDEIRTNWRMLYYIKVLWKRGLAYLLDIILIIIPSYIVLWSFSESLKMLLTEHGIAGHVIIYGIPTTCIVLFCAILESSKWGGTFGKILLRMQTTDLVGNRISFVRALWRNFLRFYIGGLWILVIPEFIINYKNPFYWNILMVSAPLLALQIIYLLSTKTVIHDHITGTVVGERLKH